MEKKLRSKLEEELTEYRKRGRSEGHDMGAAETAEDLSMKFREAEEKVRKTKQHLSRRLVSNFFLM
jgi:hypothetical protein